MELAIIPYEFYSVNCPGVYHQAADTLSRLTAYKLEKSQVDDEFPVLAIEQNLPVSLNGTEDDYFVSRARDEEDHKLQVIPLNFHNDVQRKRAIAHTRIH